MVQVNVKKLKPSSVFGCMSIFFVIRFKKSVLRLQIRERWHALYASKNSNPPLYDYGDSIEDKSGTVENDDAAQGASLLTILDGLLRLIVFFLVFVFASVLSWCIGLLGTLSFLAWASSSSSK